MDRHPGMGGARRDAERVRVTLVEINPEIAERARRRGAMTSAQIEVRIADAGLSDSYVGAVPAEFVLLVGIFGNISDFRRCSRPSTSTTPTVTYGSPRRRCPIP